MTDRPTELTYVTLESDGVRRDFYLCLPNKLWQSGPRPLIVMLHGRGSNGKGASLRYGWRELADRTGACCLFPNGLRLNPDAPERFLENPRVWNDGMSRPGQALPIADDVAYLDRAVESALRIMNQTDTPILATGFSNGASMAFRWAGNGQTRLAALAPVAGYCFTGPAPERFKPGSATPLLYVTGAQDPINPPAGGPGRNLWGAAQPKPAALESLQTWLGEGCGPVFSPSPGGGEPTPDWSLAGNQAVHYVSSRGRAVYLELAQVGHTWPGSREVLAPQLIGPTLDEADLTGLIWRFFTSCAGLSGV